MEGSNVADADSTGCKPFFPFHFQLGNTLESRQHNWRHAKQPNVRMLCFLAVTFDTVPRKQTVSSLVIESQRERHLRVKPHPRRFVPQHSAVI
jgi:hypothetical protein